MLCKRLAGSLLVAGALIAPSAGPAHAAAVPPCATNGPAGTAYTIGLNCRTVRVDGHPRSYLVYVPNRAPVTGSSKPVVFMYHGRSGTGQQFLGISGWREQADATGLVAVFPTGVRYRSLESGRIETGWNKFGFEDEVDLDVRPDGYPPAPAPWPADDVGFTDAMVADLRAKLPIDARRIYASGFSNGSGMTARLSVERSTVLAATAVSGGGLPLAVAPQRPIPMYSTIGNVDGKILEHTGPPPLTELPMDPLALLSEPTIGPILDAQARALGLDEDDFGVTSAPHSTSFRWPAVGTGPGGALFRFGVLEGVGHQYPNGTNNPAGFAAAPEFWNFFRANRLP
jgi:poly(3-hydroxybutyrate) depolymerase